MRKLTYYIGPLIAVLLALLCLSCKFQQDEAIETRELNQFHQVRLEYETSPKEVYPASGVNPAQPASQTSQVIDANQLPMANATVTIQRSRKARNYTAPGETSGTMTDANGVFVLSCGAGQDTKIVIQKPGYATRVLNGERSLPRRIVLEPGKEIKGKVMRSNGTPIAGALIGPLDTPEMNMDVAPEERSDLLPDIYAKSDAKGEFHLSGLRDARYQFTISAHGISPTMHVLNTGTTVTLALDCNGTTVAGVVSGSRDHLPKPGVVVRAVSDGVEVYSETDMNGRYTFSCLQQREWTLCPVTEDGNAHPEKYILVPPMAEDFEVDLILNQGVAVGGQLLDADTSAPLTGEIIELASSLSGETTETATNANGYFYFPSIDAGAQITLRFDSSRYILAGSAEPDAPVLQVPASTGEDITTISVQLHQKPLITGEVIDKTGRKVSGAMVRLTPVLSLVPAYPITSTITSEYPVNPSGDFSIRTALPARFMIDAVDETRLAEPLLVDALCTQPVNLKITLNQGVFLTGMVTDSQDNPVSGALLKAIRIVDVPLTSSQRIIGPHSYEQTPQTDSGPTGIFSFKAMLPGKLNVVATHEAYAQDASQEIVLDVASSNSLLVRFPAGEEFTALVQNDNDEPIAKAEVKLFFHRGPDGLSYDKKTDDHGKVSIRSIPASMLDRLAVTHPSYAAYETSELTLPQSGLNIILHKRASLKAIIEGPRDANDTVPPAVTLLKLREDAKDPSKADTDDFITRGSMHAMTGEAEFTEVEPGWYKVAVVTASGYRESEVVNVKGEPVEVTVSTGEAFEVGGHVIDSTSREALAGAVLSLHPETQVQVDLEPETVTSGQDGAFRFPDVKPATYQLRVYYDTYPPYVQKLSASSGRNVDLDIKLSRETGSITGTVYYGSTPVVGAGIIIAPKEQMSEPVASSVSDNEGKYELTGLPAGEYILSLEAPVGNSDRSLHRSYDIAVENAEPVTKDLVLQELKPVHGKVTVNGREPGQATTLLFMPNFPGGTGQTVKMESDGSFECELEPGSYSVGIEDAQGKDVVIPGGAGIGTINIAL